MENCVGVLGGLGPLATVYFMELLIRMTKAQCDQEHVNLLVTSHAATPDRTNYILGKSRENPLPVMCADAKKLEQGGASFLVIPCNTAHYFYSEIQKSVGIPVLNIIKETIAFIGDLHMERKIGILATDGTVQTHTYQKEMEALGISYALPDEPEQRALMDIIYNQVKAGRAIDIARFQGILKSLRDKGCSSVILGCTELSIIRRDFALYDREIVDSLEVLARRTIAMSGKQIKENGAL